ncbi:hypothetical protein O181_094262 [Austropuccinia psidii MF-1]|uniref:Uncharacterized protein n=1 Tax=Austropuccinia psidii MF-1 TaxID=1389203 RepID=A0A9Q3J2L6_9BASI|nr:hypothetical protein [Austropuccinia psidii MF-1]
MITFDPYDKDYHSPSNSFSNGFSSSNTCAALVGDSRKPSTPASVHIPSPNAHQSLLSSRDEFFKEMKDGLEDSYISSVYLFLGNVDHPPSSYHESLEEFWN